MTSSIGLIEQAVTVIGGRDVALHVLIRPRAGGFHYTDDEFDIIQRDIIAAKMAGADGKLPMTTVLLFILFAFWAGTVLTTDGLGFAAEGIVFGALDGQDKIDVARMKLIREISRGMILTFHRAFDVSSENHTAALETLIGLGCDRLLTSGGPKSNVTQNTDSLRNLHQAARGRIEIVAAAGVSEENAAQLVQATGVTALHAGSSVCRTTSEQRPVAEPGTPARASAAPTSAAGGSTTAVMNKGKRGESPGLGESFVAVEGAVPPRALEELRTWQCVDEDRVCRLVAVAKAAVAQRQASSPKKGSESPMPDADYVRI